MRAPTLTTVALCFVLAVVRIAGTHVHVTHDTSGEEAVGHDLVTIAEEDSPEHLLSHLHHGDVDADDDSQLVSKSVSQFTTFLPALLLIVLLVVDSELEVQIPTHRPELRPPRRRTAFALSPPSHAPPVAFLKA